MSYCRWSSDDFQCDLYCYEDVDGGWTTHVAERRTVGDVPPIDYRLLMSGDFDEFTRQSKAQAEFIGTAEHVPIGGPHDGKTFRDPTLRGFRDRLIMLREAGYRFPDHVFSAIEEEMAGE